MLSTVLKIIGGEYRSRVLAAPPDAITSRPYAQRARAAVFNLLREWFDDARVLDLFAGVGTMGLEAVSRGARSVVMVERDRSIFRLLEENIRTLGCGDRAVAVQGDALGSLALARAPRPVDVAFVDPPYAVIEEAASREKVLDLMSRCREVLAERSFVVLRAPFAGAGLAVEGLEGPESHRYGRDMWVHLYAPA